MDKSRIMIDMVEESNKKKEANLLRMNFGNPYQISGGQFSAAPYPSGPTAPSAAGQGAYMQPPPYSPSQTGNMMPPPMVINVQGLNKPGAPMFCGLPCPMVCWKLQKFPVGIPVGNPPVCEKVSVRTRCTNCSADQFTRVDSRVSSNGKTWAILWFCFGFWLLSLLVFCMDGFKDYLHFCSSCHAQLAVYRTKMSGGMKALLVLLTLVIIVINVLVVFVILWKTLCVGNIVKNNSILCFKTGVK